MKLRSIYSFVILALSALISLNSCQKFLDQEPKATSSEEAVFTNPSTAFQALMGVYNRLGNVNYGLNLSLVYPFDTDEMVGFLTGTATDAQRSLNAYAVTPGNTNLGPTFNRLYGGVERANICIYNIPRMPMYTNGTEEQKRQLERLHGEALTLRALFYSELLKLWGDLPAHFQPSSQLSSFSVPKTDRDTIYDRIIEDLRIATDLVPWRKDPGVADDERITKGAVKALRARIALFRGGYSLRRESRQMERSADYLKYYTIARDECSDIMAKTSIHKLNPSFRAVWEDNILDGKIEPNGEVLLEVAMGGESGESDSQIGTWNGIRVTNSGTNYGNNRNFILPTLFYAYSPQDTRRDVSSAPFTIVNGNYNASLLINIPDGKWRRDWITPAIPLNTGKQYYGINWPIIRFSDVLLMYAEAVNELQEPTTEAIAAVNQVRRRAWAVGSLKSITISSEGTGYTTIPTVSITGGGGTGATAAARINGGKVVSIDIISTGANYTSAPTITVSGGGGTGFSATTSITRIEDADLKPNQTANQRAFLTAIQDERLFEFASEGIRKYDLIRWNILGTKLSDTKAELVKMANKVAPYDQLPQRMFYRQNSTTGVVWGNSLYAPTPASVPAGHTAVNWLQSVTAAAIIDRFAASFTPNKSEILPIPQAVVEASQGAINQDFGY